MGFWIAFALFGMSRQTGPLTVDQAVQIAEQNAFSVQISQTRVARNRAQVSEARGNLGPRVNLSGSYTRFDRATTVPDGNGGSVVVSPIDSKQAGVTGTLPIDISGALRNAVNAARENLRAAQQNLVASSNDIRLQARQAFFQVLRAERLVGVQEQAVKDAQEQVDNVTKLEQGGLAAHVDVLSAQVQLQQSKADLINAQNFLQISEAAFNATLARPIDTPVELVDVSSLPTQPTDEPRLRSLAQSNRPEARSLLFTRNALADLRKVEAAGNKPNLGFSVGYNRNLNQGQTPYTASATLSLNWPIFDSGITRARVEQVRQDEKQAEIQYNQLLESISQEVRQALVNLNNTAQLLDVATAQVTVAEENLRLARIRYQAGEGILLQVTDAETVLTQARTNLIATRYDYLDAYAQLQRALGSDDLTAIPAPAPQAEAKKEH